MDSAQLPRWPGIAGQVALVTGASRGIGQAIAWALGAQGAIVVGTATTQSGAERIEASFGERGIRGFGAPLDVRSDSAVTDLIESIIARESSPTILINNAGITRDNLLMRMKTDEWNQVIDTNLSAIFRVTKACIRGMVKAKTGRIINVGSVVGLSGNPGQVNYAAAKAGVIGFSKSLARELASRSITVNVVAPGFIETDMTGALGEDQVKALSDQIPSGRLGTPDDVAAAVVYLASDAGRYVTGETLNVNGGLNMH